MHFLSHGKDHPHVSCGIHFCLYISLKYWTFFHLKQQLNQGKKMCWFSLFHCSNTHVPPRAFHDLQRQIWTCATTLASTSWSWAIGSMSKRPYVGGWKTPAPPFKIGIRKIRIMGPYINPYGIEVDAFIPLLYGNNVSLDLITQMEVSQFSCILHRSNGRQNFSPVKRCV